MRRRPERGHAHQKISIATDCDRQATVVFKRQCGPHRNSWAATYAAAAIGTEIVERVVESPSRTVPRQRNVRETCRPVTDRFAQCRGKVIDRKLVSGRFGKFFRSPCDNTGSARS